MPAEQNDMPVEQAEQPPLLALSASTEAYLPGKELVISWIIGDWSSVSETEPELLLRIPVDFTPVDLPVDAIAEGEELVIRLPLKLIDNLTVRASDKAEGSYFISGELVVGEKILGQDGIKLVQDNLTIIGAAGGLAQSLDGRIKVTFPANVDAAVSEATPLRVHIHPLTEKAGVPYTFSLMPFEIDAEIVSPDGTKSEVKQFDKEFTITVDYEEAWIKGDESTLNLKTYNAQTQAWEPVSSWVDTTNNRITAHVDHMSPWDFSTEDWQASLLPNMKNFQASNFSGAATYSFPIQVPPGPGGLQPALELSYNSQVVDSATGLTQSSWAGMGWSFETGYIQRNLNGTMNYLADDTYFMSLNGLGGTIYLGADGYYHTEDENFLRIQHVIIHNPVLGESEESYWVITAKDGTRYYLGENPADRADYNIWDRCSGPEDEGYYPPSQPLIQRTVTWRWALNRIVNIHGKELTYQNETEFNQINSLCDEPDWSSIDHTIYPRFINYPHEPNKPSYRIEFKRLQDRKDWAWYWSYGSAQNFFMQARLKEIEVQHDADGDGLFSDDPIIRKYVLTYAQDQGSGTIFPNYIWDHNASVPDVWKKTLTLIEIQEFGYNGAAGLPAVKFTYDEMHLTKGENGYGGEVTFEYSEWHEITASNSSSLIQNFGAAGNPCNVSDQEGGWGGYLGGQVSCVEDEQDPNHGMLRIYNFAGRGIEPGLLRPGGYYLIEVRMKEIVPGDAVQLGLYDGYEENTGPLAWPGGSLTTITFVEKMSAIANNNAKWLIKTYTHGLVDTFIGRLLLTRYRVTTKTIKDGTTGQTSTYKYTYDEPATNDAAHSAYIGGIPDEYGQYTKAYSEFRGHAMMEETNPSSLSALSFYHQDDARRGRPSTTITAQTVFTDSFNIRDTAQWSFNPNLTYHATERLEGDLALKSVNPGGNWDVNAYRQGYSLTNGEMALVQFRLSGSATQALLAVENPASRWGIYAHNGIIEAQYYNGGWNYPATLIPNLQPDRWYVLMLVIDDGHFLTRVWERDNPAVVGQFDCVSPSCSMPGGLSWHFKEWVSQGTIWLDEYREGKIYSLNDYIYASQNTAVTQPPTIQGGGTYNGLQYAWSYLTQDRAYSFAGSANWLGTSTYYRYWGNPQYGNLTGVVESWWDASANSGQGAFRDYRTSLIGYYPNTTGGKYLVGLPGLSNQYQCPESVFNGSCFINGDYSNNYLLASRWYLYDDALIYSSQPQNGKLTGERTLLTFAGANYSDPRYVDAKYGYDAWGNRTSESVYKDYNDWTHFAGGPAETTSICYGGGEPVNDYPCTNDGYHIYPQWSRNALGHQTTTDYASVVVTGTTATGYTLGVPFSVTDPNGAATSMRYDRFGRIVSLIRPGHGDTVDTPTMRFTYFDTAQPFYTQAEQKTDLGYYTVRKYYSSLGQLIQAQAVGAEVNGTPNDILTDYYYDTSGRLTRQSVPYTMAGSGYRKDPDKPFTRTIYDSLGRPTSVKAPDDNENVFEYGILGVTSVITSTDARGNITASYSDVWGQTVLIDPPDGPSIEYEYDTAGQLVQVTYGQTGDPTQPITTTLTYDYAGRKTSMHDADMGLWGYAYNALGNLTRQTDAREQTTCLYYDALNRLKGKNYRSDANCPGSDPGAYTVTYTYDSTAGGNYGKGRRTGMTDASGSTSWVYDSRGRITQESKTIDGQAYDSAWVYNTADLVEQMTYPSGEVITYSYTTQMALDSLAGTASYLNNTTYDEAGRMTGRSLNAGLLSQAFTYNGWTETKLVDGQPVGQGARLESILTSGLQNLAYTYDTDGNILTIVDDSTGSTETHDYDYDTLNRLVGWDLNGVSQETYGYDANTGNLAYKGSPSLALQYNDGNHKHAATAYNGWEYTYDANGNTTTRHEPGQPVQTLVYDAENRLVLVHTGIPSQPIAEYTYDGDGNLVKAEEGGKVTVYIGPHFEACLSGCAPAGSTPTPTPTATATATSTATPTPTATATHTATATATATTTATPTITPTVTSTMTITPTPTATPTLTHTATSTPTPTATTQPPSGPAVDSVSSGSTNTASLTISHTTSGTDRLMLVGVSINNDNLETVTSVTYNGVGLTFVGAETQNDDARVELWRLVAPPIGAYNVVITFSADLLRYAVAGVITLTGVDQTTPLGAFAGNNATSNAASVSVPSATGDLVLGVLGCETCNSVTFTSPAVQHWNVIAGSGNEIGAGATNAGASPSTTVSAALGSSDHWAMGGIAVKPVAAGGPTATSTSTPTPTHTATPTATNTLTPTATSTATVTPTPTITSQSPSSPAVDSVSTGSTNGLNLTIAHTTSGTDRLMLVGVSINNDNLETVSSITYDGIGLTYVGSETQNDDARVELWKLVAPPTGTYNVVITFSQDLMRYTAAGVITFTGVNQTAPLGSFAGNNATSSSASVSVSSSNGDLVLGVLGCETCTSVTFTAPATQRWNVIAGSGNEIGAGATSTGASPSTTISASLGSSDHWAIGGVAIKPVGGSGSSSGSKVLAVYRTAPQSQVNARPRQVKGLRMLLTLSRDPGVVWRSYYYSGSARIALREDSDDGSQVYYILTDHLDSTSVTYRASDGHVDRQWYTPWGETRQVVGQLPTDRTFTGQREAEALGMLWYNSRFYDPYLNQWNQPDSIIPDLNNPLDWNRYSFVRYNPIRYNDPSGHMLTECGKDGSECRGIENPENSLLAILGALKSNPRSWDQLPEKYKDILVDAGYTPAKYNHEYLGNIKGKPTADQVFIESMGIGGTTCDYIAYGLNSTYMVLGDVITVIYPPAYPGILGLYQYYSVLPNSVSTLGLAAWFVQGIAKGDNQFKYHISDNNAAFSLTIAQDTAVAITTNAAGWIILREPNVATIVDGLVAIYDSYRNVYIPDFANISISLNSSSGWQIYIGK